MFQNMKHRTEREEEFKNMDLKSSKRGFHRSPGTNSSVVRGNEADRLVRCVNCGWICDKERDSTAPVESWMFLGINYGSQITASTSVGDSQYPVADPYMKLLVDFTPVQDETGKTVTLSNVTTTNTLGAFGGAAGAFNGTTSFMSLPSSSDWNFGTGDFTITTRVMFNSTSNAQTIVGQRLDGNNAWNLTKIASGNKLQFLYTYNGVSLASYVMTNAWSPKTNQWYQIKAVRNGSTFYIAIDEVAQTLTTTTAIGTNDLADLTSSLIYGSFSNGQFLNGWIDKPVVRKGIAVLPTNTVPKQDFYYVPRGADLYYERTLSGGCPCCGSPLYEKKPDTTGLL